MKQTEFTLIDLRGMKTFLSAHDDNCSVINDMDEYLLNVCETLKNKIKVLPLEERSSYNDLCRRIHDIRVDLYKTLQLNKSISAKLMDVIKSSTPTYHESYCG